MKVKCQVVGCTGFWPDKQQRDLLHDGDQMYHSFVSMPIRLSNFATMDKIQKNS